MDTIENKVTAGCRYLTAEAPEWVWKIDLSLLDLSSVFFCVLGQLDEKIDLNWPTEWGVYDPLLGFDLQLNDTGSCAKAKEYAVLTDEWVRQITELREAVPDQWGSTNG